MGQLSYIRPYVDDFSPDWLLANVVSLTAGAMVLVHVRPPALPFLRVEYGAEQRPK